MIEQSWVILAIPLLGAILLAILGRRLPDLLVAWIGCGSIGGAFLFSCLVFLAYLRQTKPAINIVLFSWIETSHLESHVGLLIDPLSLTMMLIVTGIGFFIHLFSVGYMKREEGFARYFAYMNLFSFAMLLLVMADNFLLLFVGWEGVGFCSYILIGYAFWREEAASAGKKAFIVNRIGDFAFLIGLLALFATLGTFDFLTINETLQAGAAAAHLPISRDWLTLIAMLFFIGAIGKSAQIPLYIWLPDAMAGPTPVSAFIHAATMVAAGVYLVVRANVIYQLAPAALFAVGTIGALTAIYAASIALVQDDLKRMLAYSTISQLGYMFLAVGVGAFAVGMFHLVTHAFFKALLFLCVGVIMHALSDELNMWKMGGLKEDLPLTALTYLVGALAISGIVPFSGFFSKEKILHASYFQGRWYLWLLGIVGAAFTAFYIFRSAFLAFFGKPRSGAEERLTISRPGLVMSIPLLVLMIGSLCAGWIGIPEVVSRGALTDWFEEWLADVVVDLPAADVGSGEGELVGFILMGITLLASIAGILCAAIWYRQESFALPARAAIRFPFLYSMVKNSYWVDEAYELVFVKPFARLASLLRRFIEALLDGVVHSLGILTEIVGALCSHLQTGALRNYALWIVIGFLGFAVYVLWR